MTKVWCNHSSTNAQAVCYDVKFNMSRYKPKYKKISRNKKRIACARRRFENDFTDLISQTVSKIVRKQIARAKKKATNANQPLQLPMISLTMFVGDSNNRTILQHFRYMDPYGLLDEMHHANHLTLAVRTEAPQTFLREALHRGLHFRFRNRNNVC